MKSVYAKRLIKLAEFLEDLPRKQFSYEQWVGFDWKGAPDLSCGTTACAFGWATTIPAFRRLGLRLKQYGNRGIPALNGSRLNPSRAAEAAAAHVFGLDEQGFLDLFIPGRNESDATPRYVAKKIRRYVAETSERRGASR